MDKIKFPPLKADQVECRVGTVGSTGYSVLLYKTARTDMDILDEVVGPENWQNEFFDACGKLFCRLSIRVGKDWISKSDCGVEGNVGEEKSQASDARKRAGFAWGIGRELYNSPFIWLNAQTVRDNNGRYKLERYPRLEVTEFESDGKKVTRLVICDQYGNALFRHGEALKEARKEAKPAGQAKAAQTAPAVAPIMTATFDKAPHIMTKEEFRTRWNSNDNGGGITFDDIADCAIAWGISARPKTRPMEEIRDKVLAAAGCEMPDDTPSRKKDITDYEYAAQSSPMDDSLAIALNDLKNARDRAELQSVHNQYKAVYGEYGSNRSDEYVNTLNEMCQRFPRVPKTI